MEQLLKILNQIKPDVDFSTETNLVEKRILTSFDILKLVVELNNEFDIEITPLHTIPENFQSVEAIWNLIQRIEEED